MRRRIVSSINELLRRMDPPESTPVMVFSTTFRNTFPLCVCLLAIALSGCGLRKPKSVTPVVGPPPPRTSYVNNSPSEPVLTAASDRMEPGETELVSVSLNEKKHEFSDTQTVAYINGEPLLAGEILEPYAAKLKEVQAQVPPAQFVLMREQLIQRDLETHIDNKLLIQAFKSGLKKEQKDMLDNAVMELFNKEIERMKAQFGVNTDYELTLKLQKEETSIPALQKAFGNRVMAAEFLKSKSSDAPAPSRVDLLAEYERVKDEKYFKPARVRWEQILVSFGPNGGKDGALRKLTQAATDLRDGVDFAEVAKKHSDGPGADQGGYWDWMLKNSLADREIEEALFEMPIGRISDVFVGETAYQVVRVLERERARHVPFEDVQEEIKENLVSEHRKKSSERVMQELRDSSTIETIFDKPKQPEMVQATPSTKPLVGNRPSPFNSSGAGSQPFQQTSAQVAEDDSPFVPLSRALPLD